MEQLRDLIDERELAEIERDDARYDQTIERLVLTLRHEQQLRKREVARVKALEAVAEAAREEHGAHHYCSNEECVNRVCLKLTVLDAVGKGDKCVI